MNKLSLTIGTLALAATTTLAMADPGAYGYGMGMGGGCGAGAGPGPGAAAGCPGGYGPGAGPGYGRGGGYGMHGGGQGMALLTPEEQAAHRTAMHSFKTVEACTAYMTQHQQLLQERAKAQGVTAPLGPRGNPCERMKARGMIG